MFSLFTFLSATKKHYRTMVAPVCERYNLTQMEFDVIMFLFNNPDYDTAKDIVCVRQIAKSHASLAVHSLEGRGLLEKEFREGNKRTEHLVLTLEAKTIAEEGRSAQKAYEDALLSPLTPEERKAFLKTLEKLGESVRKDNGDDNGKER